MECFITTIPLTKRKRQIFQDHFEIYFVILRQVYLQLQTFVSRRQTDISKNMFLLSLDGKKDTQKPRYQITGLYSKEDTTKLVMEYTCQ